MPQTFIIADDHPLFRQALVQAVKQAVPDAVTIEADGLSALQESVDSYPDADLVLLDLLIPGVCGFSGLVYLRGQHPDLPVVVVSAMEEAPLMRKAIDFGASGYIPKSSGLETITEAIKKILQGEVWIAPEWLRKVQMSDGAVVDFAQKLASLTPQQFRVLSMMADGMLNKQIAYELEVSEATIKAHITAIFRKLDVRNRTQAVIAMQELGAEGLKVGADDGEG